MATATQSRKIRMNGAIQSVDVDHNRLKAEVYGIEKQVQVPPGCRITRNHIDSRLGELHTNERVHIECSFEDGLLHARSIEAFPPSP